MNTVYRVSGMTCEHCVAAVTRELAKVEGVRRVDVELAEGLVHVDSDATLDRATVRDAVDEAGFELQD